MRYFIFTWKQDRVGGVFRWQPSGHSLTRSRYNDLNLAYSHRDEVWRYFAGQYHYIILEKDQPVPQTLEEGLSPTRH